MTRRSRRRLIVAGAVLAVAGGAVALLLIGPSAPSSLAEAIEGRGDEFPADQRLLLPPTAGSRLGYRPAGEAGTEAGRRLTTEPEPCFFVTPRKERGLDELRVTYGGSRSLAGDLGGVLGALGVDWGDEGSATLSLAGLRLEAGVGVPNLNGPCGPDFASGARIEVVTAQIVADEARLEHSRSEKGRATARVGKAGAGAGAKLGWERDDSGIVRGRDIVLSGSLSAVSVRVTDERAHDLGGAPAPGSSLSFPDGFDGRLVVDRYDASGPHLTIRADVPLAAAAPGPEAAGFCAVGDAMTLSSGRSCQYLVAPNALVSARWEVRDVAGERRVLVFLRGYRTSFDRASSAAGAPVG